MQYHKTIDIWHMPEYLRKHIHAGQWVSIGGVKGRYLGQTKAGVDVVSWINTAQNIQAKRAYALAYGSK